ncbi:right-handed parallel beta-helix repeat-containing protein [Pseudomonas sp. R37(2017)]|uniref:right-handed parallel beta-helix repeat-containing protein n=1 Tax=Pseudomonas sp. R37(2017) TaxID=1981685 RepID=UPI000A1DEE57|nr:right-handed parallel beta-helix repeat-containing protein [Pseudomonas sp. R37(2017)]
MQMAGVTSAGLFATTATSSWSQGQEHNIDKQQPLIPGDYACTQLAKDLVIADGGINLDWAINSLEQAIQCESDVRKSKYVGVLQFERLIEKKTACARTGWNWSHAIQAAIDLSEAKGLICVMPPGVLRITQPLQMGSNSKLFIPPETILLKDFNSLDTFAGTIKNKRDAEGVSNVLVFGGGTIKSSSGRIGKHIVFFNSNFVSIANVKIRSTYSDWTTKFQNCNYVLIYGNDTDVENTEVLTDGWHFKGGSKNIVVANNRVRTGDDCIAFTQEVQGVDESGDIERVTVVNNTLDSAQSSLIKLHVRAGISTAIRRISINNVDGKVGRINEGGFALYLSDEGFTQKISDIKVSNLIARCEENGDYCARVIGCRDVKIENFEARDALRGVLIEDSYRICLDHLQIRNLRGQGVDVSSGITLQNTDRFWITNPVVSRTRQHGIQLGSPGKPAHHGVVVGGVLSECLSTGLRLANAAEVSVEGVKCLGNRNGIVEDRGSRKNLILRNRLSGNSAVQLSLLGNDTVDEENEVN